MSYKTEVYQIIKDENQLDKYISTLIEEDGLKYYVSLFARKKYGKTEGLKSDKAQLKRFVATPSRLKQKLKQLEVPVGTYEIDGVPINEESLIVYISANPRDMHRAGVETALELTKKGLRGDTIKNPHAEALSKLQTTGKKLLFNVDLDFRVDKEVTPFEVQKWLDEKINYSSYRLVRTRGGFHILVNLEGLAPGFLKTWYNNLRSGYSEDFTIDMSNGDGMLPLPGCIQSDFVPKIIGRDAEFIEYCLKMAEKKYKKGTKIVSLFGAETKIIRDKLIISNNCIFAFTDHKDSPSMIFDSNNWAKIL